MNAGAQTKRSAVFHGSCCSCLPCFYSLALNLIPLSALAVVLIFVGIKLNDLKLYSSIMKRGREEYVPFFATLVQASSRQTCSPASASALQSPCHYSLSHF
jgi:MFS superfamily sulfate permease-like transporter